MRPDHLTTDQTQRLIECREEWRTIGLTSGPVNRRLVKTVLDEMYKAIERKPVPLLVLPSPASALIATMVLFRDQLGGQLWGQLRGQLWDQLWGQLGGQLWGQLWGQLGGQLRDQLRDQLWGQLGGQLGGQLWGQLRDQLWGQLEDQLGGQLGDQLGDQLWGQLGDQLGDQLWGQLGDQLGGQIGSQLWGQLWGQLGDQLRGQLWDQLRDQLRDQLGNQLGGQFRNQIYYGLGGHCDAYWIAFYRFAEQIGCTYTATDQHRLAWWDTLSRHCGWWWPYENVVIASDRPTTRWNAAYQLHAEDGPAIEFPDGYSLWALNGVRVPKQLVITASHDLDPQEWVVKQSNAAIRQEAVRKIGIERVCARLQAQVLDRRDDYELLTLNLGDKRKRPYLKMVNPSTGTYHIEGVPSHITTIQEALTWRNQSDQTPKILT